MSIAAPTPLRLRAVAAIRAVVALTRLDRFAGAVTGRLGPMGMGLAGLVVVLFGAYFALLGAIQPTASGAMVPLSDVRAAMAPEAGGIKSATLYDEDARIAVVTAKGRTLVAAYPRSDSETSSLIEGLQAAGAKVLVDQQASKARLRFLVQYLLPLVILAGLFGLVFLVTSGKGGAAEFAAFSKLGRRRTNARAVETTTFGDVAGAGEAVTELAEVVDYLRNPARYANLGARAPKGVLLVGPPGTGKTLLARAVAGEAGVPFFSLSGSEFVESLVGVGAARVRDLFRQARETAPAIIFIDEIDAAGRQRGAGMGQGNDEREQTLNQLLVEMDGFSAAAGIAVLAATNRPDILDPALLRPGRFDRQVVVDAPDVDGRVAILQLYVSRRPLDATVDLGRIARQTPGFTGAEIANLVNEAALVAVRADSATIGMAHLEEAVDRVIAGPQRKSRALTPEEKRLVAYHEAGHAVAAAAAGLEMAIDKISIVPRGRTLGHTTVYKVADRSVLTQRDLHQQLTSTMGGPAVEQLVLGEVTTGSEGDLQSATSLARTMIANLGMGESVGRVAIGQKSGEVFLGRDFTKMQEVSPATLEAVDREVRSVLDRAERDAMHALEANRAVVDAIAGALYEKETLSGEGLRELLEAVVPLSELTGKPRGRSQARA